MNLKLGHQAPKGYRINNCNAIHLDGDFAYCPSLNFIYNPREEERKMYDAQPCFYTDKRFTDDDGFNSYLYQNMRENLSIKAAIRRTLKCKGIPKGTIVDFNKSWHYAHKKIDNGYKFKIRKENTIHIKYKIDLPDFSNDFRSCQFSQDLTNQLRQNGFIVLVWNENPDFICGDDEGEIAIAYGFNKKIGFSSQDNYFRGYTNGKESILWDKFDYFDKWSRCEKIPKTNSIKSIIEELKE